MVQRESSSRQGEISNQRERIKCLNKANLRRYSRRDKAEEAIMQSTQSQESSPSELPSHESSSGELPTTLECFNDLDKPIAQRKGVRSCTKHPISNFVSYESLSPSYRAFALSISFVSISQD